MVNFYRRYERFKEATKQVPVPPEERRKKKPMMTVPEHSPEEVLKFLGVIVDEEEETINQVFERLDPSMWDALDWREQDDDSGE